MLLHSKKNGDGACVLLALRVCARAPGRDYRLLSHALSCSRCLVCTLLLPVRKGAGCRARAAFFSLVVNANAPVGFPSRLAPGYVDSDAKMQKIFDGIKACLSA